MGGVFGGVIDNFVDDYESYFGGAYAKCSDLDLSELVDIQILHLLFIGLVVVGVSLALRMDSCLGFCIFLAEF